MNGLLILNKDKNMTSFDCVAIAKKVFNTKKVGHTGTLDPLATGVLVLCVGDATKLVPFLEADSKTYIAEVLIGKSTTTYDLEGEVTKETKVSSLSDDEVDNVLKKFVGNITQTPPIYSAIKVNGKKLYEYARNNKEVEIPQRNVTINSLERISDVVIYDGIAKFSIKCDVSKGTYIRSLCFDIAKELGYPGLMSSLVRTRSGNFKLDDSYSIDDLKNGNVTLKNMIDGLSNYKVIDGADYLRELTNGKPISFNSIACREERIVLTLNNELKAIYELDSTNERYKALRIWN